MIESIDRSNDIATSRATILKPIEDIAALLDIPGSALYRYGPFKAKVALDFATAGAPRGKLILVTAISPTPAGEGKTTTTIGLGDALRQAGHRTRSACVSLALGPASAPRAAPPAAAARRSPRWMKSICISLAICTPFRRRIICLRR